MGGLLERIQDGISVQDVPLVRHAAGSHGILVPSGLSGGQDCGVLAFPDRGGIYPSDRRLLVPSGHHHGRLIGRQPEERLPAASDCI